MSGMEWSGRAPAPSAIEAGQGAKDKERDMFQNSNTSIAVDAVTERRWCGFRL
jgi:hypothetical protein